MYLPRFPRIKRILLILLGLVGVGTFALLVLTLKCMLHVPNHEAFKKGEGKKITVSDEMQHPRRAEENAYYSYPEWYIVYSYEERANFLEKHLSSDFPY